MGSAEGAVIVGRYIRENSEVLSFHLQRVMRSSTESVEAVLSFNIIKSVSSVAQLCPILCDPMDCSTPGFPVNHQLLELAQIHVHLVSDPSNYFILCYTLSSCLQSFPASGSFQMSHFFALGGQIIGTSASASVLPMNI